MALIAPSNPIVAGRETLGTAPELGKLKLPVTPSGATAPTSAHEAENNNDGLMTRGQTPAQIQAKLRAQQAIPAPLPATPEQPPPAPMPQPKQKSI